MQGLDGTPIDDRPKIWEEIADEFSPFETVIQQIKRVIDTSYQTLEKYEPIFTQILAEHFSRVREDIYAREFLTLILTSRISESVGYFDDNLNPAVEAENMLNEIGLARGFSRFQTW
ncbi:hypothetical protein KA001_01010 [Patescibacteria group bacterium]|nr:hypothetical protein [Patescibacteria group bacterium]